MMRTVMILAAVAAALLVILALTRGGPRQQQAREVRDARPAVVAPVPAKVSEKPPEAVKPAPPEPTPAELQVADDAAAVGLTTRQGGEAPPEASDAKN